MGIIDKIFKNSSKDENKETPKKLKIYRCESCEEQCAGHGGGVPTIDNGCLCFDGVRLECLLED